MKWLVKVGVPILIALGVILLLYGIGVSIYSTGKQAGIDKVSKEWTQEKLAYQDEILRIKTLNAGLEQDFENREAEVNKELRNVKASYERTLASNASEHAARLRNHQERADLYERKAQGSEVERRGLASHAAELDRSLEEGRQLVQELRTVVELRDSQLTEVGQQLLQTRALLEAGEPDGR